MNARLQHSLDRHPRQQSEQSLRVARVRQRHAGAVPGGVGVVELALAVDSRQVLTLEGREPVTGETGRIAIFEPHVGYAFVEFLAGAYDDVAFLLDLVRRASETVKKERAVAARLSEELGWYRQALEQAGLDSSPPDGRTGASRLPCGEPAGTPAAASSAAAGASIIDPGKNHAAEASIKCADPTFVAFLAARHGLGDRTDPDGVAAALRAALGIASRKDLNTDPAAADRWRALRADFDAWRTHG